jgi:hypothetical protein
VQIDERYVEGAAYHEAAHAVIAAVQGMILRPQGIRIDRVGAGLTVYCHKTPDGSSNLGRDPERERTIISTAAGFFAHERFYIDANHCRLPASGASDDLDLIVALLKEMYSERRQQDEAQERLMKDSERLVTSHWKAIELVATELWAKSWSRQGALQWSPQEFEKVMEGAEVASVLATLGIKVTVQPRTDHCALTRRVLRNLKNGLSRMRRRWRI